MVDSKKDLIGELEVLAAAINPGLVLSEEMANTSITKLMEVIKVLRKEECSNKHC